MTTAEKITVMQAFIDGKTIETRINNDSWMEVSLENNDDLYWNWEKNEYRIKPETKYVPYEIPEEIKLGIEVQTINKKGQWIITGKSKGTIYAANAYHTFKEALERFEYMDGTPFGKEVKE